MASDVTNNTRGAEAPTQAQIHAMCVYVRGQKCSECPASVDTLYGSGQPGCHAIAEETLERAWALRPPPPAEQRAGLSALTEGQWQPIEAAPRDGTEIFAYWGKWRTESGMEVDSNCCGTTLYLNGVWINPDDADDEYRAPTYWMPIPAPPAAPVAGRGEL